MLGYQYLRQERDIFNYYIFNANKFYTHTFLVTLKTCQSRDGDVRIIIKRVRLNVKSQ